MADDTGQHTSPLHADTGRAPAGPPRWSAAKAARECGIARSTIHEALKSGRLEATKDADGAWQITPQALVAAGYAPGMPTKVHEPRQVEDRDDGDTLTRLRIELVEARAEARVLEVERDAERRMRVSEQERREAVERERDRMLEAPPQQAPESPQTDATPMPDQTPTPDPVRPPQANVGRFRRAWNVARFG